MANYKVILPAMGESIEEATVIKWLKNEGDLIKEEDLLLEIATDKVDSEVPSPVNGILKKKLIKENETLKIGEVFALIEIENLLELENTSENLINKNENKEDQMFIHETKIFSFKEGEIQKENKNFKKPFYSPLVKSIAKKEKLNEDILISLPTSGKDGRLTKDDILDYIGKKSLYLTKPDSFFDQKPTPSIEKNPTQAHLISDEIIEMNRMQKIIASKMLESKKISPHVTSFIETDVTNMVKWREKIKSDFEKKNGSKFTYMPIFIWAVTKTLKEFPIINSQVKGEIIELKKQINIGIATALSNGDLIVPVIKNCDDYNLKGLAKQLNNLTEKARNKSLEPQDTQEGTYTISNIGSFGNLMGTPIIYQPQVAILAIGAIVKKPSVIETPQGDLIGIKHKMYLSHTYDHRIINGSIGCSFLKKVAEYLESFDLNTSI